VRFAQNSPALRHRDFRLLWTGPSVSLVGSAMQNAAMIL
jgi:hypothetical protein